MFTKKQPPMPETVCVATVYNPVDRGIIQGLLTQSDIPNLTRPRYGLDPLPVLAGSSVMGEEIYVMCEHEAQAREIIDAFTNEGATPIYEDDGDLPAEEEPAP